MNAGQSSPLGASMRPGGVNFSVYSKHATGVELLLPPLEVRGKWRRWIDTALDSPHDIVPWQTSPSIDGLTYRAEPHSIVVLFVGAK